VFYSIQEIETESPKGRIMANSVHSSLTGKTKQADITSSLEPCAGGHGQLSDGLMNWPRSLHLYHFNYPSKTVILEEIAQKYISNTIAFLHS